jgi:hypothetical protein
MVKWTAIVFGAVPFAGWLLSIPWNLVNGWGEWSYLPLIFTTFPCLSISDFLNRSFFLQTHNFVSLILYTLICMILYALAGYFLALFVQMCMTWNRSE